MSSTPHILIVKTGTTEPSVVAAHGDYDAWFVNEISRSGARHSVVAVHAGDALTALEGIHGVILTGSPLSVRDEAPWMKRLGTWAIETALHTPVLAVCFGHQLVGEALGGRVEVNPLGGEYGTIEVELTEAGRAHPLFQGFDGPLSVQSTHKDVLVSPPTAPGTVLLGSTPNTRWQTFSHGTNLHAVQFHPELPAAALADLMTSRGIPGEPWPTTDGSRILANWLGFVRKTWQPSMA